MQSEVIVKFDRRDFRVDLHAADAVPQETALQWMDEQFVALECEPLRASGKLLRADKVLVVARDAGATRLEDPEWFRRFAAATVAVLGKPVVRLDTDTMTVAY